MLSRQRQWQLKQIALGKCSRCGKQRNHYKQFCDDCMNKYREYMRKYYGYKKECKRFCQKGGD